MLIDLLALMAMQTAEPKTQVDCPAAAANRLVALQPHADFPAEGMLLKKDFGTIEAGISFNEAIVSWNVENPDAAEVTVRAAVIVDGHESRSYVLGNWAYDTTLLPRTSVEKQSDSTGTVLTDTLHLNSPATALHLTLELSKIKPGSTPRLKLVTIAFSNTKIALPDAAKPSAAWGKTVDVPQRAQGNYPNGGVLCSPTSVSMLLSYYSRLLHRPELDKDVPEVEAGVWDKAYKGAGNWPFNTAYAGSFPGMVGYVSRLNGISDLESWIDAGIPVACSVSFDLLRGKPLSPTEQGHLIVLVGFAANGDPVVNDPAFKDGVRKTYPRSDFENAWRYSHRTVYFIHTNVAATPANPDHLWVDRIEAPTPGAEAPAPGPGVALRDLPDHKTDE